MLHRSRNAETGKARMAGGQAGMSRQARRQKQAKAGRTRLARERGRQLSRAIQGCSAMQSGM